ncbi:MAG: hypothetical protein LC131_09205 [Anaerolineae bacterium]|nr:hypothetical protein [Promineifilum sp.]MCZ2113998.1 hypothetical protein [Anaerolineae bacterium]
MIRAMIRRISILAGYYAKGVFFSLTGLILLIFSLVYWSVFFPPGQGTPDVENYIVLIGAWGAAATFLATLALSGRASRLENYPLITRLPSRVEYLVAVLLGSLILGAFMQLLVAGLALIRGPEITSVQLLAIPPVWLSINLLAAVLACHASDLVTAGWSRVILFGFIAIALVFNSAASGPDSWFSDRFTDLAQLFARLNLMWFSDLSVSMASWAARSPLAPVAQAVSMIFWPFNAISDAIFSGRFTPSQALAPAILVLYGTILFLIAATLFAGKDLEFLE